MHAILGEHNIMAFQYLLIEALSGGLHSGLGQCTTVTAYHSIQALFPATQDGHLAAILVKSQGCGLPNSS